LVIEYVASFGEAAVSSSYPYRNQSFIPESSNLNIPHLASYKVNSADLMSVLFIMTFTNMQMSFCVFAFLCSTDLPLSMAYIIGVLPRMYPAFRVPFLSEDSSVANF
jgi:hypothetical protein